MLIKTLFPRFKITLLLCVCMIACFAGGAGIVASELPIYAGMDTAHAVWARNGMVSSQERVATDVGVEILRQGGNAIDAAIAMNAALGLMEPTGNGMGGDLFAIVWDAKSQNLYGLNASGRSPLGLTREWFIENGHKKIPAYGPLPVSVPGAVDGWFELHDRFGRLPMTEILQPAIDYARDGFPVSAVIAAGWARNAQSLKKYAGFAATFMPGGKAPAKGEIFKTPDLPKPIAGSLKAAEMFFIAAQSRRKLPRICNSRVAF